MLETSNTTEEAVDDTECENREIHTLKQVSPEPIKKNFQKKFNFFKKFSKKQICIFVIIIIVIIVAAISLTVIKDTSHVAKPDPEIISASTLEKIINISKLSTFTSVYNGVATVMNTENPDEVDYYVSYNARIKAGIDFDKLSFDIDNEVKTITVNIPPVDITDVIVDITSLDYIFYNDDANTSMVSQAAFKACEEDANNQANQKKAIFELAEQSAEGIITALIEPILEQLDNEYKLILN